MASPPGSKACEGFLRSLSVCRREHIEGLPHPRSEIPSKTVRCLFRFLQKLKTAASFLRERFRTKSYSTQLAANGNVNVVPCCCNSGTPSLPRSNNQLCLNPANRGSVKSVFFANDGPDCWKATTPAEVWRYASRWRIADWLRLAKASCTHLWTSITCWSAASFGERHQIRSSVGN